MGCNSFFDDVSLLSMIKFQVEISEKHVTDFCQRWKVRELSLFGSVVGEGFMPDSDIDVLVSFLPDAKWSLFDLIKMEDELIDIFGRQVDLVEREALVNPFRRHAILKSREIIYAST
jgi:predicted nucleotidyltransferase